MNNHQTIITDFIVQELAPGRNNIPPTLSLLNNGVIDSIGLLRLMAFLENSFNISVDPSDVDLSNFETISSICQFVKSKQ